MGLVDIMRGIAFLWRQRLLYHAWFVFVLFSEALSTFLPATTSHGKWGGAVIVTKCRSISGGYSNRWTKGADSMRLYDRPGMIVMAGKRGRDCRLCSHRHAHVVDNGPVSG